VLSLYVMQGPDRGKRFTLPDNEPQLIGRSSEALPITDRSVSRRHAELTPDGRDWYVRDLESANGTFLNGERLGERVKLQPGDQIRCGSTLFVFATQPDDRKGSPIRVLGPEVMDATVEKALPLTAGGMAGAEMVSSDDSLVLSSPDPAAASMRHLRILYEITRLTGETIERDDLLNRIMDVIFNEFTPDRGFILLQSDPNARPDPVVIRYRERPKTLDEGHIPVSRTIVQHTLRKGEGILATNAMNDERFRSGDSVSRYGIRSAVCVPIRSGERIFGVIHIDSSVANFTYTEEQLRLMTAVGQHTGLAMATAELVGSRVETERLAAIGETVASLSHSTKNILQGLRGGADAVELAINRNDLKLAREAWPIVARNLDRIYTLTMNMLAFSKMRSPELELAGPHAIIREAVELIQPQAQKKRIAIIQDLDESMPPIPLDSTAIHQALMNLLMNALEAAPEKKGVITIRTRFDGTRHLASIHIGDNGPGVAAEHRERIFEPFISTKGQRGTGLGLAVARKIAREHGGDVTLAPETGPGVAAASARDGSAPRAGAEFIITLPADAKKGDSSATSAPRAEPEGPDWAAG
jgi:two-component system NtrC family sensor kinase